MYIVQCTMCNANCTMYAVLCNVYGTQCIQYTIHNTVCNTLGIGGGSNPIFPQDTLKFGFGDGQKWGKKYLKREGNKVSIFKIEKIPIFAHDAPKFGFGDGKKCEKMRKKIIWKEREKYSF